MKNNHLNAGSFRSICAALLLGAVSTATPVYAAVNSGDPSLSAIEVKVNGENIVSGFSSANESYTIESEGSFPTYATFSAVPVSSDATVDISVNNVHLTNHSVAQLVKGENTVVFTVTSGNVTKTYSVDVTPASASRTVYFRPVSGWGNPKIYTYVKINGQTVKPSGEWSGTAMTRDTGDWWSYVLPDEADKTAGFVFNDGGNNQYPSNGNDEYLDFEGKEGWYDLATHTWYTSNPDGPQKPKITVSPAGGRVREASVISISFSENPTEVSGSFNGRELSLSTTSVTRLNVSDYLNDGESGELSVSASNSEGTTTFSATYNRDDSQPIVTMPDDWHGLSIYQVMVGSFQHSDNGAVGYTDMWGPEGHRKNGNIKGVTEALDYIQELGMNAIWLTPVFDSSNGGNGDEKLKATGYFANDYFKIDPHFGTDEDFRELVREAHNRGIYIILDGVFGHHSNCTGASPNGNYIDNRTASNVCNTDAGNIAYPGSLPYFKEVVRYWMDEYEVDGWRLDQCYQVYQGGHNYWNDLRLEVEAVCQERKNRGEQWGTLGYMVGEDWTSAGNITVTQLDGLKSVMDFDGKDNLVNHRSGVGSFGWFLSNDAAARGYSGSGVCPTIFLSNHDTSRVGDFVDVNSKTNELIACHAAVACYSGPACLYYGDEIGDKSGNGNADNKARTSGRLINFTANEQKVHDYVAKMFNARKENPALWRGSVDRKEISSQTEMITKTDAVTGNQVIVIFSSVDTSVSIGGTGEDLINGGTVSGTVNVTAWLPAFIKMQ